MEKKFIIQIQGKDFITYEGLLDAFHKNGGHTMTTELVSTTLNDEVFFVFKATAIGENGTYTGFGDAYKGNVSPMISKHMMRMAETRAKARALRDYNNIGMCSAEELD